MRTAVALLMTVCPATAVRADGPTGTASLPSSFTEKVALTPDLCQTDEAFRSLPHSGKYWCCPTAFANTLIALDRCGYDNLVPGDLAAKEAQRALLAELGSHDYFHTNKEGTGPLAAMLGIRRFIRDRGYEAAIQYQGWRRGGEFAVGDLVEPEWLHEGVLGDSGVVLNVGWYRHDEAKQVFTRIGGHYMTLVGYKTDGTQTMYLIQDPSPRSGPGKVTHEARLVPISSGEMAPWKRYGKRSAAGRFLVEGIVPRPAAHAAILDGAIRFAVSTAQ